MDVAYKLYRLDVLGRIIQPFWIEAEDDEDAMSKAASEHPTGWYELWLFNRHVADLKDGTAKPVARTRSLQ